MLRPLRLKVKDITGGITGLAISPALNEVKNKIPNITALVTKKKHTNYDSQTSTNETKYFTSSDYNKFTGEICNVNIKKFLDESDISGVMHESNLDQEIVTLATNAEQDKDSETSWI